MTNFKAYLVFFIFLFCLCPLKILPEKRSCIIHIFNNRNRLIRLEVEIADTSAERARGLMFRKKLNWNRGMLFIFKKEKFLNFWMKNTYIPLSIAYINSRGVIKEIYHMKPLDTGVTYPSKKRAKYSLEVNRNWFKSNNISTGNRVVLNGCLGK